MNVGSCNICIFPQNLLLNQGCVLQSMASWCWGNVVFSNIFFNHTGILFSVGIPPLSPTCSTALSPMSFKCNWLWLYSMHLYPCSTAWQLYSYWSVFVYCMLVTECVQKTANQSNRGGGFVTVCQNSFEYYLLLYSAYCG